MTTAISAKTSPSRPPLGKSLAATLGEKQGGLTKHPLSPLKAPTVCQGAQWALVKAFQESGSGEGGGEAEGGLALRNAACSRDSHGTGWAEHEMPTDGKQTLHKRKAFWSEQNTMRDSWGIKTVTGNICYCSRSVEQEVERFRTDQSAANRSHCLCIHQRSSKYSVSVILIGGEATGSDF